MKLLREFLLVLVLILMVAGRAGAALPPEAYADLRQKAPVAFSGTVLKDSGGKAVVRADSVQRGDVQPGQEVTVRYPEYRKGMNVPNGPAVYYDRFHAGDQIAIWGTREDGAVVIVHKGIDILAQAEAPPESASVWPWVAGGAVIVLLLGGGAAVWLMRGRTRPLN